MFGKIFRPVQLKSKLTSIIVSVCYIEVRREGLQQHNPPSVICGGLRLVPNLPYCVDLPHIHRKVSTGRKICLFYNDRRHSRLPVVGQVGMGEILICCAKMD
jgi:hypothetical protein